MFSFQIHFCNFAGTVHIFTKAFVKSDQTEIRNKKNQN